MSYGSGPYGSTPYGAAVPSGGDELKNLSFEIPDTNGIDAKYWTQGSISSLEEWAVFEDDDGFDQGFETFEAGWGALPYKCTFIPADLEKGLFSAGIQGTAKVVESFELGWNDNHHYVTDVVGIDAVFTGTGQTTVEDFAAGWPGAYLFSFTAPDLSAGITEAFETGWSSNESYMLTLGSTSSAVFAGVNVDPVETFNRVLVKAPTFAGLNVIVAAWLCFGHGFSAGYTVRFSNDTGTLPQGILPETDYVVFAVIDVDNFTVAVPGDISPITPGSLGTGLTFVSDEHEFWTHTMVTV